MRIFVAFLLLTFFFGFCHTLVAQDALTGAELKQIEAIMAPARAKVLTIMEKDYADILKKYHIDTAQVRNVKDPAKYNIAMKELEMKYLPVFKKAYLKAQINESAYKEKIAAILPKGLKYTFGEFMSIQSVASTNVVGNAANGCLELKCPFDVKNTNKTGSLISIGGATANDCGVSTSGFSDLAGAGDAIAFSGKKATIPANKTKVKVTATEDYKMDGMAWAVIGGAYAESSVGIRVQGPSVNKTFTYRKNWVVAPVVWFANYEETAANTDINMNFTPSTSGGDYTIQVFAKCYTFAGAAFAAPLCNSRVSKVSKIKVCWE